MEKSTLKTILISLVGVSVLLGAGLVTLYLQATLVTAESLRNDGFFVYDAPIELNDFSLEDEDGEVFNNENLQGQWTLVFFGYTFCPDICPLTLASVRQFYGLLEENGESEDVQVLMISVDPERDTREVLANYVHYFNPEFMGARGDYTEVYTLARQMNVTFNYVAMDEENYLVNHNGEVMLLDPQGNNVGFFKAPYKPDFMRENFLAVKRYLSR